MPACTRMDDLKKNKKKNKAIRKNFPAYKLNFYHAVKQNDNKNNKKER